jgi:phenylalanyl-tRNA synthetase beta chain
VKVEAPDLCPRYTARVIRGVKIGPSPAWLRQTLEKVGMRSINNVVDVTNYVLLECGQPLHAFDYNFLAGHQIIVRRANNGEPFMAIDGSTHELTSDMLVIADATRAVALAGIMGGKESEISDKTTDVLLESAWFLPPNVRRTSKRLGLSSESSYRFERGADIGVAVWASYRATQLIQDLAGGQPARGIIDALAKPIEKRRVKCRYAQVNRLLGIDVPPDTVKKIFVQLGLEIVGPADVHSSQVEVPTFRVDLEREVDLIEEVCRIHGVEKIPAKMQPANAAVSEFDKQWDALARARQILTALGFDEAMNQTLVGDGEVKLANPLSAEQETLRSMLVPGLLGNLRTNISRHQYDVRLFEVGRIFAAGGGESKHLALAVTGRRDPHSWELAVRNAKMDLFDLKGAIEELTDNLGVAGLTFSGENLLLADKPVGTMKQISGAQAKKWDLREAAFVAELDVELLLATTRADKEFKELPKFPAVVRDMALVVDESVEHAAIVAEIDKSQNKILEYIEIFDIFRGGSIPTGKKSVAYSLTFRAADRTLTDAEVNEAHERIKRQLQKALSCEIRES